MAHHQAEVEEVTAKSDALLVNLGATEYIRQIELSSAVKGKLLVFDPVGVGASKFRRNFAIDYIKAYKPELIRGNLSEIMALIEGTNTSRGVDSEIKLDTVSEESISRSLVDFAHRQNSIVIATGESDYVSDGKRAYIVSNGSKYMSKFTGSGCMLSGVLSAFLAAENNLEFAVNALAFYGIAGEIAELNFIDQPIAFASYKLKFIDNLSIFESFDNYEVKIKQII